MTVIKRLEKVFGGLSMTWPKVIIFAVITAVYTALINQVPFLKGTSFQDIAISFECWILFGILIIVNSKSCLDSGLKCLVFFVISQPLIYLIEVPFLGWEIMSYYQNWIYWTLFTFPMGLVGYFMKKDKWWSLLILSPMLIFLGVHYSGFLSQALFEFPLHLLSAVFCLVTVLIYPVAIFRNKKIKIAGLIISGVIIVSMSVLVLVSPKVYNTTLMVNGGSEGAEFNDKCTVYLTDKSFGDVSIKYDDGMEDYKIDAEFYKGGHTECVIKAPDGKETKYSLDIHLDKYEIKKIDK